MSTATKLAKIRGELNDLFYERADVVDGLLYASLTKQHAFILGPPGTAKSEIVRDFTSRIEGASYFEQLLSKNRPDQAVLGPYDLPLLSEKGEFKRKDAGFLTTAQFAFLDEAGKMSPTLGHDILAAANERIKHEVSEGRSTHTIPLHSMFAASNEHPAAESEDAAALWDRFLIRTTVDYLSSEKHFKALMERSNAAPARTTISYDELSQATDEVAMVIVADHVVDGVMDIRRALKKEGIIVSDRRWRASMSIVRAAAYLAGRAIAEVDDLRVLRFTLWDDQTQMKKVERTILSVASPVEEEALELLDAVKELLEGVRAKKGESGANVAQFITEANGKAGKVDKQVAALLKKAPDSPTLAETKKLTAQVRREGLALIGIAVDGSDGF